MSYKAVREAREHIDVITDHESLREAVRMGLEMSREKTKADALREAKKIADAMELCDWSGAPIGNKMILRAAVKSIRNLVGMIEND